VLVSPCACHKVKRERGKASDWIAARLVWLAGHLRSREQHDIAHYFSKMDVFISQSPSSSSITTYSDLHAENHLDFLPTTPVQGNDCSRWAGSKEPEIISSWPRFSSSSFNDTWSTHSDSKVVKPVGSRDTSQDPMPFCLREERIDVGWHIGHGGSGGPRVA